MTCYFRHLKEFFQKAGIEVTKENRKEIDRIVRRIVGIEYEGCPEVWREVKKRIVVDEADFVSKLKTTWEKRK